MKGVFEERKVTGKWTKLSQGGLLLAFLGFFLSRIPSKQPTNAA